MIVTTPLGPDVLLLAGFSGHEGISQLFSFELDLAAEDQSKVVFEKLLGQKVTVSLSVPGGQKRYFSGICTSIAKGMRGTEHTSFQMEVSPHLWLLTRRSRSRIFQNLSVPEILKKVLDIPDVTYELEGTFHPRAYCVQYRETDFHFASRLMEDEGIYYYFNHKADGHQMVVSNKAAFPELQPAELIFQQAEGTHVQEERISRWLKQQQLRSVKITLRDHHFQMPQKSLEAVGQIQDDVKVGKVTHKLRIGEPDALEIYDWPGEYSHRFDAIDRGGAERPEELQKLLQDNERTVKIRMEQEAVESIAITGASRYRQLASGRTFTFKEQVVVPYQGSASDDGKYVLTSVSHTGLISGSYRSGDVQELHYDNSFTGIPAGLHYRPRRLTAKPVVTGTQTAVVVGPKGEQIHTDKHGRVKVQFHWDREGKHDAASSCWIRVAQQWADKGFGAICLPRAGQEVVVVFEEGDPDRPLILGCVYNADNQPPFKLPENRMFSAIKTNSVLGNPSKNFSGLAFNDTPQSEHVALYAEKDMMINAENDHVHHVGGYQYSKIGRTSLTKIGGLPGLGGGGGGDGSGGGGNGSDASGSSSGGETPQWQTSPISKPTFGFAGTTIYGFNSQDTVGLMHQITFGQATQITFDLVNSWGYLKKLWKGDALSDPATPWFAAGGNQQLFWGNSYQSVYGANMSYTFAPQFNMSAKPTLLTQVFASLIPTLSAAYEIIYATMGDDQKALAEVIAGTFTGVITIANAVLLRSQQSDQDVFTTAHKAAITTASTALEAVFAVAASPMVTLAAAEVAKLQKNLLTFGAASKIAMPPTDPTPAFNYVDGDWILSAHNCQVFAWQPPDPTNTETTSSIYINAFGKMGSGGTVQIHASDKMTLTAGMAYACLENTSEAGGEIDLQCGQTGAISLRRLPVKAPNTVQNIQLKPQQILIDASRRLDHADVRSGRRPSPMPRSHSRRMARSR